ncbi:MAG: ABC transporter substrate-binding protein [Nitrospirae bacterium]|nr:ABC transporter substrate-binding protein [Nitrospirota bacterium]
MQGFANVNKYPVVIGAAGSSVSLAILPIANQNKIVQLSPLSSAVELSEKGGAYFFRVCPADDQQAKIVAEWIKNEGINEIAIVYTDNSWGSGLTKSFKNYYEKLGGKIILTEATNEGQTDFRSVLSKVKAAKVSTLYSPTYPKEGGMLVRQAKELGLKVNLYGADNWGAPEFTQIAGSAANGTRFVAQFSYSGPEFQQLNNMYKNKYNKDADVFVAYGYDAVWSIAKAIKMSKKITGDEIQAHMVSVKFQGASGYIEFDAKGDLKTNAFTKKQIKDGKVQDI